jgi:hypothetical protein
VTENPRPTSPQSSESENSTEQEQQTPNPAPKSGPVPTPNSVSGDVPVETWRSHLGEAKEMPAAERHDHLGALLDELDSQVGSL